jgi:Tol biopolymer transport system component
MKKSLGTALAVFIFVALAVANGAAQKSDSAEVQLKAAITKEVVDGDLKAAIEMYRTLSQGANRAVAAKALMRMGQCYERLGDTESRKAYESVVRDFADQKEAAAEARARLASLGGSPAPSGSSERIVIEGAGDGEVLDGSRDGRFLFVQEGNWGPWSVRDRQTGKSVRLQLEQLAFAPRLSPDLRRVVYSRFDGKGGAQLKVAALDGSSSRVLAESRGNEILNVHDWSPDGNRLLVTQRTPTSPSELGVMLVADGSVRGLGVQVGGRAAWSPDGRFVFYVKGGLYVIAVDGTSNVQVVEPQPRRPFVPVWAADGRHILYLSDRAGAIDLLEIEVVDGKPTGAPRLVAADVGGMSPIRETANGILYWKKSVERRDVYTVELDPATGRAASAAVGLHERRGALGSGPIAWSPDGRSLAFMRRVVGANNRIVIRSFSTGEDRDVPGDYPLPYDLHWLADGSLLATMFGGSQQLRVAAIDPVTGQQKILIPELPKGAWRGVAVSADGRTLFYTIAEGPLGHPSMTLRLIRHVLGEAEGTEICRVESGGIGFFSLSASPDGRQLAFGLLPVVDLLSARDPLSAATLVSVVTLDGAAPRTLFTGSGTGHLAGTAWTPDSRSVIAVKRPLNGRPADIQVFPVGGGAPRPLGVSLPEVQNVAISPDGRRLAFESGETKQEAWMTRLAPRPKAGK